jgi:flagellar operon protein
VTVRIGPVGRPQGDAAPIKKAPAAGRAGFAEALARARQSAPELQISAHAAKRMRAHGIGLDASVRERLDAALSMARAKGIRETLVVTRNASWIVSVPNSTVITVVPRGAPQGEVFSQIDGAVILD